MQPMETKSYSMKSQAIFFFKKSMFLCNKVALELLLGTSVSVFNALLVYNELSQ